jgi:hypothetical protein
LSVVFGGARQERKKRQADEALRTEALFLEAD